jgi:4-hydroxyphenylpyruvate dioxygenase-like putative hemolysin
VAAEMDFIFKKEAIDLNLWKFRRVATMIKFKRLDHIQICIPTGKENEARKFYTDIIGLQEISKPQQLMPTEDYGIKLQTYNFILE